MRYLVVTMAALAVLGGGGVAAQRKPYRGVNDTYAPPQFASRAGWNIRAAHLRELVLASAGLVPMPDRTPLNAQAFGQVTRPDYSVSKVTSKAFRGSSSRATCIGRLVTDRSLRSSRRTDIGRTAGWKIQSLRPFPGARSASRARDSWSSPTTWSAITTVGSSSTGCSAARVRSCGD